MSPTKEDFKPLGRILEGVANFLVGNPTRDVPENVPRKARKPFAQARETAGKYLVIIENIVQQNPIEKSLDQSPFDGPDEAVIYDLMTATLTHRAIDQMFLDDPEKQRLKSGVTAVCKRLTQRHALKKSDMDRATFREYRQVARKAADLVIKLNENGAKSFEVRTQIPPLLTHIRLLRLGEKY